MSQRVLIVEDEALIALDLSFLVEGMGHEVVATAADRREALAAAEGVDLALVDLNLRDGPTGPALGEALSRLHGITVIYLTANPQQVPPGASGPVGILPKPYTEAGLDQAVRFALGLRAGRAALPPESFLLLADAAPTLQGAVRQARL